MINILGYGFSYLLYYSLIVLTLIRRIRAFVNKENIDMSKYELGWRELSTDTFYREMNSIRQERALQGKYDH